MAYNTIDLINKIIFVAKKRKEMYKNISLEGSKTFKVSLVANILTKDVEKTIEYYEQLKIEFENDIDEIDFFVYDKIAFLVNVFQRRFINPDVKDIESLLEFSMDFEKQIVALFIDMQGRLLQKEEDSEMKAYKILSDIIKRKQKHIRNIQKFIKK